MQLGNELDSYSDHSVTNEDKYSQLINLSAMIR